jgi:hypothetical protein
MSKCDLLRQALEEVLERAEASEDNKFSDWPQVAAICRRALPDNSDRICRRG